MRKIERRPLAKKSVAALKKLQDAVTAGGNTAKAAASCWDRRRSSAPRKAAFKDVQLKLREMSRGLQRCMYCEDSAGTDIDHFRPKSLHPGQTFRWANYLWACSHCNSNEKRSQFPVDVRGAPMLIDPTNEDPYPAFQLVPSTGLLVAMTPRAVETDRVFGLNRREVLTKGRRPTWTKIIALVRGYREAADDAARARHLDAIRDEPFQAVVYHFVRDALAGRDHVPADIRSFVTSTRAVWESL